MRKIFENHREKVGNIDWKINIIAANSHVAKSLRPVINIKMPGTNEDFEFDLDTFAQFRLQLAHAVKNTVHK
ncbi:unnamed protein product [Caenorhabditis angaria]|uniref:COMM domain-containing protein n=1 Tax=Caenorhabditis angaria TaxID=860376 RepID=A0A9P1MZ36_9PELO|nr:unnamed protein product [Caenorhabditis angaria]